MQSPVESRVANLVFGLIYLRSEVAYPKIILKKGNLSYDDINALFGFNNLDYRKKYLESLTCKIRLAQIAQVICLEYIFLHR